MARFFLMLATGGLVLTADLLTKWWVFRWLGGPAKSPSGGCGKESSACRLH